MTLRPYVFHEEGKPHKKVKVRCLGPGNEHTFLSISKSNNRMCNSCMIKLAAPTRMRDRRVK